MIYLYNFLQFLCAPLLLLIGLCGLFFAKYRGRLGGRLGFGLAGSVPVKKKGTPRIWMHALSVGEVRSAAVLLEALARHLPQAELVLSATTRSGLATAREQQKVVRCLLPFPLDLWFSVSRFLERVEPDLFVLVETDFWPNFLCQLQRRNIPAVLVNGRISAGSWRGYRLGRLFFRPLFSLFAKLYLQTEEDASRMRGLGVNSVKVGTAGNLKYDAALLASSFFAQKKENGMAGDGQFLVVAGSTHAGEEEILLEAYARLGRERPDSRLVIAPRDISRAPAIGQLAAGEGLRCDFYSQAGDANNAQVVILDVFGRLMEFYQRADLVYIGGSLVAAGGHNPLEAAVFGKPIFFGPHMEDFAEIERDLLAADAALVVTDRQGVQQVLLDLAQNEEKRRAMAERAKAAVFAKSGCADRIAAELARLLGESDASFSLEGGGGT